jgi:hypothetical protein
MKTKLTFEEYLRKDNLSKNTITSYLWTVNYYTENYDAVSKENLLAYKGYLMEFFKPKTVNLRIQAINKYLEYLDKQQLQLKAVKVQQEEFLNSSRTMLKNTDLIKRWFTHIHSVTDTQRIFLRSTMIFCLPKMELQELRQ